MDPSPCRMIPSVLRRVNCTISPGKWWTTTRLFSYSQWDWWRTCINLSWPSRPMCMILHINDCSSPTFVLLGYQQTGWKSNAAAVLCSAPRSSNFGCNLDPVLSFTFRELIALAWFIETCRWCWCCCRCGARGEELKLFNRKVRSGFVPTWLHFKSNLSLRSIQLVTRQSDPDVWHYITPNHGFPQDSLPIVPVEQKLKWENNWRINQIDTTRY